MKILLAILFLFLMNLATIAQQPEPSPRPEDRTPQQIAASKELDEAAASYKAGKFADAQQHSAAALALDPESKVALRFLARSVHAQYRPGVDTPENRAKAQEAIAAYRRILERDPNQEEALSAIAALYHQLGENEIERQWLWQKATNFTIPTASRIAAYEGVAQLDLTCARRVTEPFRANPANYGDGRVRVPLATTVDRGPLDQALQCANDGIQTIDLVLSLTSNDAAPWRYRGTLLLDLATLAGMDGRPADEATYIRQAGEARQQADKLAAKPAPPPAQ